MCVYECVCVSIHGWYATLMTARTQPNAVVITYEMRSASSAFSCLKYVLCTITYQLLAAGICSCHARYVQRKFILPPNCPLVVMTFAFVYSSKVDFTM